MMQLISAYIIAEFHATVFENAKDKCRQIFK